MTKSKLTCCFTGHRPEKMTQTESEIRPLLEEAIDSAINDGYITFITGMAMGVDIWAAEIVLERKKTNKELHLTKKDTLIDFNKSAEWSMRKCFEEFGLEMTEEVIPTFHKINDELWRKLEKGMLTKQ